MHILAVGLVLVVVLASFVFAPWPFRLLGSSDQQQERINLDRFEPLLKFIEKRSPDALEEFWVVSGKNTGLASRWLDMTQKIRLIQWKVASGTIDKDDAAFVYSLGVAQTWMTVVSIFESGLCAIMPSVPHSAARMALQLHWQLSLRVLTLTLNADEK